MATEEKADIEKGFGTWKVKLKVNMLLFCVLPREGGKKADRSDSTQSTKIRENRVNRDRRKGRRG